MQLHHALVENKLWKGTILLWTVLQNYFLELHFNNQMLRLDILLRLTGPRKLQIATGKAIRCNRIISCNYNIVAISYMKIKHVLKKLISYQHEYIISIIRLLKIIYLEKTTRRCLSFNLCRWTSSRWRWNDCIYVGFSHVHSKLMSKSIVLDSIHPNDIFEYNSTRYFQE